MNKILTGIKDLDLYILQKLDDRSILNFLITCKDLYTEKNFYLIFGRRYPELVKFKRPDESLKSLYLRMLHYIILLKKEFRIVYGKEEMVNPILDYGFKKYEIENEDMHDLLIKTSRDGILEVVRTSLEAGADIHSKEDLPLRLASYYGRLSVVQYLVEKGADIHALDDAPLISASHFGHLPVVQYLAEKGANIHAQNDYVLRWVSEKGYLSVVKYLVESGANILARDNEALILASINGHLPVAKYLVERGADIHAQNDWALIWARENEGLPVAKYLVEASQNINK